MFFNPAPSTARNGEGLGSSYFLQGNETLAFAEAAGQETVLNDIIADQSGSGGAGSGSLSLSGPGTLELDATNTYTGGTTIFSGTLFLAAIGAAGSGPISFAGNTPAAVQISAAALPNGTLFSNTVKGFANNQYLDFTALGYSTTASATIDGNILSATGSGGTDQVTLGDSYNNTPIQLQTFNDGSGGVLVSALTPASTDTLHLNVAEDAYQGDAEYTISVDGVQQGGIRTATASHAAGATQNVTITGNWGPTAHAVDVTFLNDDYGGSAQADRNLYVDSIIYDGVSATPPGAELYSTGTMAFVTAAQTQAVTFGLALAEDQYQGDAQYAVAVDGQQLGGVGSVTASQAAGQTDVVTLSDLLTSGTHDLAVSFLNDLYGGSPSADRNLYLDGVTVDGRTIPGALATFYSNGTDHFTIVVPQA